MYAKGGKRDNIFNNLSAGVNMNSSNLKENNSMLSNNSMAQYGANSLNTKH